jgi:hypothetical protein
MLAAGSLSSYVASGPPHSSPQLYRRFFTAAECQALDSSPADSALSEISLLRILLTRLFAAARRQAQQSRVALGHLLSMLAGFSHATMIIASLVRIEEKGFGSRSEYDPKQAANAALDSNDFYHRFHGAPSSGRR